MAVTIEVKDGSSATVDGPARMQIIAEDGAVTVDGQAEDFPRIAIEEGQVVEITGPATLRVTSDVPGSVLIDGEPVTKPPEPTTPPPEEPAVVSSLDPETAVAGDPTDITMTVTGSGFTAASVIVFDGLDEPTTLISPTQVSTGVKPSLFVVPADCLVGVRNAAGMSNELVFSFTSAAGRSSAARPGRSRS
jgi:hypothetical protein